MMNTVMTGKTGNQEIAQEELLPRIQSVRTRTRLRVKLKSEAYTAAN